MNLRYEVWCHGLGSSSLHCEHGCLDAVSHHCGHHIPCLGLSLRSPLSLLFSLEHQRVEGVQMWQWPHLLSHHCMLLHYQNMPIHNCQHYFCYVMQGKHFLAIHLPGRKSQFECQKEFLNLVFVDMPWSSKRRQCIPMPMSLHIKNITLLQSGRGVLWLFQPTISNNAHTVLQPVHTRHCWRKSEFWD
jgi:hypothetical protein